MENYNPNIDLMYLKRIADDNLAGSEILWNSKNIFSSWHLLHESLEKILKVLWAKENLSQFKDQDDLNKKLRNFGHDILNIVESLNEETKKGINKLFETDGLLIYKLIPLRYAEISFVIVSDENFFILKGIIEKIKEKII